MFEKVVKEGICCFDIEIIQKPKKLKEGIYMKRVDIEDLVVEYKKNKSEDILNEILNLMEPHIKYWCQTQCYLPWEKEDLLQVARIAVVGALERFDPDKEIRFKTFAYKTVTGKILNYYRDNTWRVSIPRKYRELSTNITKTESELYQKTGEAPGVKEIASTLGLEEEVVEKVLEAKRAARATSLSEQLEKEDNKTELIHFMGKEDINLQSIESKQDVANALGRLEEIKRKVIYLRFYEDLTQSKVAQILGVSQMQVSRLERMALGELKKYLSG
ncbi:MAG: polymerase sigma-B factor [Clostridia bacterium]|nr:polymerase sigma-B factor [Clostridia bacterium]MDN5321615.1 polymerase sigma-B factor [Clostridia bacterium]